MNLDPALQTFVIESRELLQEMETILLEIEQADDRSELVNAIFRAAHTIKGSSGMFGLESVVAFTHVVESVLDRVRNGQQPIDVALLALLLSCSDHIGALVDAVDAGQPEGNTALNAQGESLLTALRVYLAQEAAPSPSPAPEAPGADTAAAAPATSATPAAGGCAHWLIAVRLDAQVLCNGMDPLACIRFLCTLGRIVDLLVLPGALPEVAQMDPELCYLGYAIALESSADAATLEGAFEFVREDCQLHLIAPHGTAAQALALLQAFAKDGAQLAPWLLGTGAVTAHDLDTAQDEQGSGQGEAVPAAQAQAVTLADRPGAQPDVRDAIPIGRPAPRPAPESRSVRIDANKLDQLINLVGELIIVGAGVNLVARRAGIAELQESTSKLSCLIEEMRDSALQLRMVKIGATFSRFQRVVHDISHELGKDIGLLTHGEDTELDKTVIEKIGDPLMHLVRNAMDHGIEPAEVRAARGKPLKGMLRLNAFHDSSSIVITVEDDGGGLNRQRIAAKALERGLIESAHDLSDAEVYALIFEPGFSTAELVSNLSGRGVGLDVVKRNITALRGSVGISSQEGVGTMVTVRLPLTLAIIDSFLVEVGTSVFAIPLDMIEECVAYSAESDNHYTNLRGQVLPFVRLRELFGITEPAPRRENIVVLKYAGQKTGLVVDTLLGEFQTVIKPLGEMFQHVKCLSGSTILASGSVALILDVPALMQQAGQCRKAPSRPEKISISSV